MFVCAIVGRTGCIGIGSTGSYQRKGERKREKDKTREREMSKRERKQKRDVKTMD